MPRHLHAHKLMDTNGMSLLEIILAVTIVVVSLSALVTIANTASRNVAAARGRTIADQYVRAGTEQLRSYRDNQGWARLLGKTTPATANELVPGETQYYTISATGTPVYRSNSLAADICAAIRSGTYQVATGYYRVIKMTLNGAGSEAAIEVTVCYGYRGTFKQQSSATTILTNWR